MFDPRNSLLLTGTTKYQHVGSLGSLHVRPQKLTFVHGHNEISTFWTSGEPPCSTSDTHFCSQTQRNTNMLDLWGASMFDLRSSLLFTSTMKNQHFRPPASLHVRPKKLTFVYRHNEKSTFWSSNEPPCSTSEAHFCSEAQ